MKRFRPRAKGSASPINKRTTHITSCCQKNKEVNSWVKSTSIGMRVGIIRDWDAKWYAEKNTRITFTKILAIRKFIQKKNLLTLQFQLLKSNVL